MGWTVRLVEIDVVKMHLFRPYLFNTLGVPTGSWKRRQVSKGSESLGVGIKYARIMSAHVISVNPNHMLWNAVDSRMC